MRDYSSLVGKTIGELYIQKEFSIKENNHWRTFCVCKCSCGNIINRRKDYLKENQDIKMTCGHNEQVYKEFDENTIIGFANNNKTFLIDKNDFDNVSKHIWSYDGNYVSTIYKRGKRKIHLRLHVFIMFGYEHQPSGTEVDHINRNKLDCRKENLRIANRLNNTRNSSIRKNNKSGITGVFVPPNRKYWESRITINKKVINLGTYNDFLDAVKARLKAEKKYFGEFAPQKHLFEQYGI